MRPNQLIQMLAEQAHLPDSAAADEIDRLVGRILRDLRRGAKVSLPGIGTLQRSANLEIRFHPARRRR